jgi:23S rRNA maturation mini-RNase III
MAMETLQEKLRKMVIEARKIHAQERSVLVDSLRVIWQLAYWRAELYMGGKHEHVAKKIGLTPDQYFKRLRVAKLGNSFPRAIEHLQDGRTCLSHLALIGDKITEANEQVIWDNILDKGRREVEDFLRRVQPDGSVKSQADQMVTLQITVTAEQEALIHRLTEVLSARGHVPTTAEAIMTAVDKLLDQRDQLRRATKMAAKDAGNEMNGEEKVRHNERMTNESEGETPTASRQLDESEIHVSDSTDSQAVDQILLPQGSDRQEARTAARRKIPEALKRAVYLRAGGRCQHRMADGRPCGATRMLEIDHILPVARGGRDEGSNLTLVCREHNQYRARLMMGDWENSVGSYARKAL